MTLIQWVLLVVLFICSSQQQQLSSSFRTYSVKQIGSMMADNQSTEENIQEPESCTTTDQEACTTKSDPEAGDQDCPSSSEDQKTRTEEAKREVEEKISVLPTEVPPPEIDDTEDSTKKDDKDSTEESTEVDSSINPEEEKDSKQTEDEERSREKHTPTTEQEPTPTEPEASSTDATEPEASSTDPPAKAIPKINHPMKTFPQTLAEFGYTFKDGRMQNISSGGFVFEVVKGDKAYNQQHYEALGEVITEHVYSLLESEAHLQRIPIPEPKPKQKATASSFFFASMDYLENPKMMVLIHGSGVVRAGQWARRLIINDCLDSGTQLPFIRRAVQEGYSVVVLNTNLNHQIIAGKKKKVKGNSTPEEHAQYVWKNYIKKSSATQIYIVAHSYGGIVTTELANKEFKDFERLVQKVAFTDSVHSTGKLKRGVKHWMEKNAINWVTSDDPLDHPQHTLRNDVPRVSAGTIRHEETSWYSFESIFKYFTKELSDTQPQAAEKAS